MTNQPNLHEPNAWQRWIENIKTDPQTRWITIAVVIVVLGCIGVLSWAVYVSSHPTKNNNVTTNTTDKTVKYKPTNNAAVVETPAVEATTAPRRIDGQIVAVADANKVPGCVMIENAAFSGVRPQAGLSAAQVVYEIIVEGGITRWMAVFAGEHANMVGPVRSARDTYLEFASEYNCGYFHAGGSYTAMQAIRNFALRDVDGLMEGKWYWRDSGRFAPHNLFTSTDNIYKAISEGHSWTEAPTYDSWKFVDDTEITTGDAATEINIGFGGSYDAKYLYNTDNKNYERYTAGVAHTDSTTGKILSTRNIIIEHVPAGDYIEGKGRINFSVTGTGAVDIIRDGKITKGQWKKDNRLARTQFVDEAGYAIPLARGNSWVEIVPDGYGVEIK